ncbi:hypothetical protein [Halobaculum marinum]|uniref:Uncharacterized protein n=1 Tax=Halobaculum marinum TaxID=3031996 RepID=A0ABD5WU08_9EURY|nr:hypothetical protein [Halobaculum sp. DT55]
MNDETTQNDVSTDGDQIEAQMDEMWEQRGMMDDLHEYDIPRDSPSAEAGVAVEDTHGAVIEFKHSEGESESASVVGEVVGETQDGQPIVSTAGSMNKRAVDGNVADGIGAEHGKWGRSGGQAAAGAVPNTKFEPGTQVAQTLESTDDQGTPAPVMAEDRGLLTGESFGAYGEAVAEALELGIGNVTELSHMTIESLERAIANEKELAAISEVARPVRDRIAAEGEDTTGKELELMEEVEARVADRITDCRESLAAFVPVRKSIAFDFYSDDDEWSRTLARESKDFDAGWTSAPEAAPSRLPHQTFGRGAYTDNVGVGYTERVADKWADESAMGGPALVYPEHNEPTTRPESPIVYDEEGVAGYGAEVEEWTMNLVEKIEEADPRAFDLPGVDVESIRSTVASALAGTNDTLAGLVRAKEAIFHSDTQSLMDIEPWWSGCSALVRVTELFEPADPSSQQQVAYIEDASPFVTQTSLGGSVGKLTVWKRSGCETMFREGDVVRLSNPAIGGFGNQLTFAVTSDTYVDVVAQGDGPATSWRDAMFETGGAGVETHNPDAYGRSNPRANSKAVNTTRYRRPSELVGHTVPNGVNEWTGGDLTMRDALHQVGGCGVTLPVTDDTPETYTRSWEETGNFRRSLQLSTGSSPSEVVPS